MGAQLLTEQLVEFGFRQFAVAIQESVHIHGLPVTKEATAAVVEEIAVIDAGGNHEGGALPGTAKSYAGDAFLDGQEHAFRAVPPFRKHTVRYAVGEGFVNLVEGIHTFPDGFVPVPFAGHRKDLQEMQNLGGHGLAEDIGPGTVNDAIFPCAQHHQRIHQGVAMVGRNEHGRSVFRQVTLHVQLGVTGSCKGVYILPEEAVPSIGFPDVRHRSVCCG